jgi:transcriptional regulator with XRE-family HTH domain
MITIDQKVIIQIGGRLKMLRQRAMISQADVGERLGVSHVHIRHLESGLVRKPSLELIAGYLRACGARWSELADILERTDSVPIETGAIDELDRTQSEKDKLKARVQGQVDNYCLKLPYRANMKPIHPDQLTSVGKRLRNYRLMVNLVEEAVLRELRYEKLTVITSHKYTDVARSIVGLLWRNAKASSRVEETKSSRAGKRENSEAEEKVSGRGFSEALAKKEPAWQAEGLSLELIRRVESVVTSRFRELMAAHPDLSPRSEARPVENLSGS